MGNDRWVAAVAHKYNAGSAGNEMRLDRELPRGVAFGVQVCERVLDQIKDDRRRAYTRSRRSRAIPALTAFSLHQHHNRPRSDGVMDTEHLLFLAGLTDVVGRVLSGIDDAVPRPV